MDKVVAKANIPDSVRSSTPNPGMSTKPCRYGDSCSRLGCRFRHSFDSAPPPIPSNNPYCSNNWLPLSIHMSIKNDLLSIVKQEEDVSFYLYFFKFTKMRKQPEILRHAYIYRNPLPSKKMVSTTTMKHLLITNCPQLYATLKTVAPTEATISTI